MVHPVGSYCTDISRCMVNKTLNFHISYPNKVAAPHRLRENKDVTSITKRVPSSDVIGNRFPDSEGIGKMSKNQGRVCLMVGVLYCSNAPEFWSEKEGDGGGKRQLEASEERVQVPCLGQM
jgi:hypothetical protein